MSIQYFIIPFIVAFISLKIGLAHQIEGRPTLPSDCKSNEHWVRDHNKTKGNWTSYCRINPSGQVSKSYKFWAPKFHSMKILPIILIFSF